MEFLNTIKGAIGWLGGALAALTAICYGAGYFSYHAHLTMLGLNDTVDFTANQMLLEGSQFFLGLLSELLYDAFISLFIAIVAALVWMLLKGVPPLARASGAVRQRVVERWGRETARHPFLASGTSLLLLATVLVFHNDTYFEALTDLGTISHLLFRPVAPLACQAIYDAQPDRTGLVASALIARGEACRTALQDEFVWLVRGFFLLLLVLLGLMSRVGSRLPQPARSVAKIGLGLYAALYLLWLPVAYGVLVRAPIYPSVDVAVKDSAQVHAHLLAQEPGGVVIWQDSDRSALWYPAARLEAIKVTQVGNIFERKRTTR